MAGVIDASLVTHLVLVVLLGTFFSIPQLLAALLAAALAGHLFHLAMGRYPVPGNGNDTSCEPVLRGSE